MSILLNSNIASLRVQSALGRSSTELESVYERLASGARINRAADDAAGLSVASSLNVQSRLHSQALRNLNDGVSYLNIAEGASKELSQILFRMRELSTQSANGSYSNTQRGALNSEVEALQNEYNRVLATTTFNGQEIFSQNSVTLQAGIDSAGTLAMDLRVSMLLPNGTFQSASNYGIAGPSASRDFALGDVNNDGITDLATVVHTPDRAAVLLGNSDGTFQAVQTYSLPAPAVSVTFGDSNGDGQLDLFTFSNTGLYRMLGNGDGTFGATASLFGGAGFQAVLAEDFTGDGREDLFLSGAGTGWLARNLGNGTYSAFTSIGGTGVNWADLVSGDFNGDGKLDLAAVKGASSAVGVYLGNGNGTFSSEISIGTGTGPRSIVAADFNGDGLADLATANSTGNSITILAGNGNGTFLAAGSFFVSVPESLVAKDFNGDGQVDLAIGSNTSGLTLLSGNGDATFAGGRQISASASVIVAQSDFNYDRIPDLVNFAYNGNSARVFLGNSERALSTLRPLDGISVATQHQALVAQGWIDEEIENVSAFQGVLGSWQSRLRTASSLAATTADVLKSAEARVLDADIAAEGAQAVRISIVQKFGAAVLAQANLQPRLALDLLR